MAGNEVQGFREGPVLKTLAGCRARINLLSLGQRWRLCYELGLRDPEKLARALWTGRRRRKSLRKS